MAERSNVTLKRLDDSVPLSDRLTLLTLQELPLPLLLEGQVLLRLPGARRVLETGVDDGPPVHELGRHVIDPGSGRSAVERLEWKEHLLEGSKIYCLSLALYLHLYQLLLTPREKKALHKVEVENLTYRAAAEDMGIRLENFKMAVSRARKKIYYGFRSDLYFRRAQSMKTTG